MPLRPCLPVFLLALQSAALAQIPSKLSGLDFGPYLDGQDPADNQVLTPAQLQQRLAIVAPFTGWIRTYGCGNGLAQTTAIAHNLGLKVAAGIWIGSDAAANNREIACALADTYDTPDILIVGSEALRRGDVSVQQLLGYIQTVRERRGGVPIAVADTYDVLLQYAAVLAAVDIVMANIYPFWQGIAIDQSIASLDAAYRQIAAAAPLKRVIVSETGWPSAGNAQGAAIPSPANAAAWFQNFVAWANTNRVQYFYFEAFDEAWKAKPQYGEGAVGASWGIWDHLGNLKPGMEKVLASPVPVSVSPSNVQVSTASYQFTFADPRGWQHLDVVNILINDSLDGRHACYLAYSRPLNTLYLVNDSGDALLPGLTLNAAGSLHNTQCAVDGVYSSAAGSGATLVLNLGISFGDAVVSGFSGDRIVYMAARDIAGNNSGWLPAGLVQVPGQVFLTATSILGHGNVATVAAGKAAVVEAAFDDINGVGDFGVINFLINDALDGRHACYLAYVPAQKLLYLVNDDGTALLNNPLPLNNQTGSLGNGQCTVNHVSTPATPANGRQLWVSLQVSFSPSFTGNRLMYVAARDVNGGNNTGWHAEGLWFITPH